MVQRSIFLTWIPPQQFFVVQDRRDLERTFLTGSLTFPIMMTSTLTARVVLIGVTVRSRGETVLWLHIYARRQVRNFYLLTGIILTGDVGRGGGWSGEIVHNFRLTIKQCLFEEKSEDIQVPRPDKVLSTILKPSTSMFYLWIHLPWFPN